jgi:hypothetical protein
MIGTITTTQRTAAMIAASLTSASLELFRQYAADAPNWSGMPCVGGNVGGSAQDRGNLTQLKRLGLITTRKEDGQTWIIFTPDGTRFAKEQFGLEV